MTMKSCCWFTREVLVSVNPPGGPAGGVVGGVVGGAALVAFGGACAAALAPRAGAFFLWDRFGGGAVSSCTEVFLTRLGAGAALTVADEGGALSATSTTDSSTALRLAFEAP
jgi:hypothetical protein